MQCNLLKISFQAFFGKIRVSLCPAAILDEFFIATWVSTGNHVISTVHVLFQTTGTYHTTVPFGKTFTGALYVSLGDLLSASALEMSIKLECYYMSKPSSSSTFSSKT